MSKIRPTLKRLHSPDISNLETHHPEDEESFGFLIQAMFGPEGAQGEESFDMVVCTPKWFEKQILDDSALSGRHHLFVKRYDIEIIRAFLIQYARTCAGETWQQVAEMLSRISKWEFEDYRS